MDRWCVMVGFGAAPSRDTRTYPAIPKMIGVIENTPYNTFSIVVSLQHRAFQEFV
jgi:hypothetical protein